MMSNTHFLICPRCRTTNAHDATACVSEDCKLDLAWVRETPVFHETLTSFHEIDGTSQVASLDTRNRDFNLNYVVLSDNDETQIGASDKNQWGMADASFLPEHCVIRCRRLDSGDCEYWISVCSADAVVRINGERIASAKLAASDLVWIGPIPFVFNHEDEKLVPVEPLEPVSVVVRGLRVYHRQSRKLLTRKKAPHNSKALRLSIDSLQVGDGEFVGIVGGSGSGKSTLLKAIGGLQGSRHDGTVTIDSYDIDRKGSYLREVIGYVPQDETVHRELTAIQAIQYTASLRGCSKTTRRADTERQLLKLQVPRDRWTSPIRELSGGERKRVCTAVELLSNPRLLLLDEPGSGLDAEREQVLMKSLRTLSQLGCTVIVVAHNVELVRKYCSRVLVVKQGEIGFDGCPSEFQHYDSLSAFPVETIAPLPETKVAETSKEMPTPLIKKPTSGAFAHYRILVQRECAIINRAFVSRFIFPTIVLPLIFAFALGIAIYGDSRGILWFFSILATIWMGSSLTLTSITGEREIFEHEKHLYLKIPQYVLAKVTVFGVIGILQVLLFSCLLVLMREAIGADSLRQTGEGNLLRSDLSWIIFVLSFVSIGASSAGLLLSAVVRHNRQLANLLLPLFMIAQIVFSVPISTRDGDSTLAATYNKFHAHDCKFYDDCGTRASFFVSDGSYQLWFCGRCNSGFKTIVKESKAKDNTLSEIVLLQQTKERLRKEKKFDKTHPRVERIKGSFPDPIAAIGSYVLISRYGDIGIRSFTGSIVPSDNEQEEKEEADEKEEEFDLNNSWFWESILALCGISSLQIVAVCIVLSYQTRKRPLFRGF